MRKSPSGLRILRRHFRQPPVRPGSDGDLHHRRNLAHHRLLDRRPIARTVAGSRRLSGSQAHISSMLRTASTWMQSSTAATTRWWTLMYSAGFDSTITMPGHSFPRLPHPCPRLHPERPWPLLARACSRTFRQHRSHADRPPAQGRIKMLLDRREKAVAVDQQAVSGRSM